MNGYASFVQTAPAMLNKYGGPVGVLGRLVGLGQEELESGAPWWAWLGVGTVVGGVLVYSFRHKIK